MHLKLTLVVLVLAAACQTPSVTMTTAGMHSSPAAAQGGKQGEKDGAKKEESAAEKRESKRKELRGKQRELAHAQVEHKIAALDQRVTALTVAAELEDSAAKLETAQLALDVFLAQQRPRELEEHKITIDRRTHSADHAKDELGELTAMYDADEFAKTTKELVLKRGRRSLEMAERELAVAKKEQAEFEGHTLLQREKDLRSKVDAAKLARSKAEFAGEKAAMQAELAAAKESEKLSDLAEDIARLQTELAQAELAKAELAKEQS